MNSELYERNTSAIYLYAVNQATIEQPEELQDRASEDAVAVGESDHSYAAIIGTEQLPCQPNSVAVIECTLPAPTEREGRPLSTSSKESSKATVASAKNVFAAVKFEKQSKMNAKAAEVATSEESSKGILEPAHVRLPPARQISSNGETPITYILCVGNYEMESVLRTIQ